MPCYKPLNAVRSLHKGPEGKYAISFSESADGVPIQVACGQCIGCRLERSRQWAIRCMHESQMHDDNCFITLTYDPEYLPADQSLDVTHWQKFMKRLRKNTGQKIRFFHCGEYGETEGRPHYHACLFGYDFPDKIPHSENHNGDTIYESPFLEKTWGLGFCTVGALTYESAAYCARYVMKKITGTAAADHYERMDVSTGEIYSLEPEYTTMSRRPGIGSGWYYAYKDDLYPDDYVVVNGKRARIPKFYDKYYEVENPTSYEVIKKKRTEEVMKCTDNTADRLEVKRKVKEAQIKQLKRKL